MTTLVYLLIDIPLITLITNLITGVHYFLTYEASLQKNYLCCLYVSFMAAAETIAAAMTGYTNFSVFSQRRVQRYSLPGYELLHIVKRCCLKQS